MQLGEVVAHLVEFFGKLGQLVGGDDLRGSDVTGEVGGEDVGYRLGSFLAGFFGVGVEPVFEIVGDGDGNFGHGGSFRDGVDSSLPGRKVGGKEWESLCDSQAGRNTE